MKGFINKALKVAASYDAWDWGWLKVTLISFGILVGTYFAQFFMQYIVIVWIIFVLSYVWIV